jgi:hypothetical protein
MLRALIYICAPREYTKLINTYEILNSRESHKTQVGLMPYTFKLDSESNLDTQGKLGGKSTPSPVLNFVEKSATVIKLILWCEYMAC